MSAINHYPEANISGRTFDEWATILNAKLQGKLSFLEIGAADGVSHDALHKHIMANPGWSGLLVEPLPDMFEKLQAAYAGRDNLAFENAAITEADGTAEIARIPPEKVNVETPSWADGISTLKPSEHIIGQEPSLRQHMVMQPITTMTIASLVKKHDITHIDLFQSDTEGYDKVVFDQVWSAGFRPSIIKLEINYMYYHVIRDVFYLLVNTGYTCFYEGDDLVAVKL